MKHLYLRNALALTTLVFAAPTFYAQALHPDAPVCGGGANSFTESTITPLTDNGVTTSTITISGVSEVLWDLDLTAFIDHTFSGDLDITLTSPSGTSVTVTSDNGAGNDNIFSGTQWDNDANPGGMLPYTTNNGVSTDHAYVNTTLASPLTPEESFAAFRGENPNGVWTLTISDDLTAESGTLNSWTLDVYTMPASPIETLTTFTDSPALSIPTGPAVVSTTMNVSGLSDKICDLDIMTDITHTFAADLDISVTSPSGTIVTLTTDNGSGNDNVFAGTVWDDSANPGGIAPFTSNPGSVTDHVYTNLTLASPLAPEEPLAAFDGEDPNGTWTITISDDLAADGGTLQSWELRVKTCAETDTDGDTFGDTCDSCPADAGKQAPGDCGCGVPDVDLNSNSISDCLEPTPTPTAIPPTIVPTAVPTIPAPTAVPTAQSGANKFKYELLTSGLGVGTFAAPSIKALSEDEGGVTIRSCFDFKKLKPSTANVYLVLKAEGKKTITRRVKRGLQCSIVRVNEKNRYQLYYLQTRSKQSKLASKKSTFRVY